MMAFSRIILFLLSLLLGGSVEALPSGAPVCTADEPAPPLGPHPASSGSLADGGLAVTIDGQDPTMAAGTIIELTVGTAVTVTVTGSDNWRGIMARIPGATIDLPSVGGYQPGIACPDGVGAITHTNDNQKMMVSFTLTMDQPGSNIGFDFNIVRSFGTHFYSQFLVNAVAMPVEDPPIVDAPTASPVDSPMADDAPMVMTSSPTVAKREVFNMDKSTRRSKKKKSSKKKSKKKKKKKSSTKKKKSAFKKKKSSKKKSSSSSD